MADMTTDRLMLPLLNAGQAQKEFIHNEALARIDMATQCGVESADLTAPPASPIAGQCWIVATGASGAWTGQDGCIAGWTDGGWRFLAPSEGYAAFAIDRGHRLEHDGAVWRDAAVRGDGVYFGGVRIIGAQAGAIADPAGGSTPDPESRNAIAEILAALRGHGLIA